MYVKFIYLMPIFFICKLSKLMQLNMIQECVIHSTT